MPFLGVGSAVVVVVACTLLLLLFWGDDDEDGCCWLPSLLLMFSLENCFYSWVRGCGRVGVLPGMTSGRRRRRRCATTDRLGVDHPERG
jgi:hypothetical protein